MAIDTKMTSARVFVRSLNILLKFTRLYGFDHARTAAQFETVWTELRAALPDDDEAGLLLAASGSQLLLDGVPSGTSPAERSFAQLLSAAGLASIHFSPSVTQDDLGRFVRAFPAGGGTPAVLAEQLRSALDGVSGIRLNEICFVPSDSGTANLQIAAQLAARTLGANTEQLEGWFNDPQKLLQLIAAAEGSKGGSGESIGSGTGGGGGGGSGGGGAGVPPVGPWAAVKAGLLGSGMGAGTLGGTGLATQAGGDLFFPQEEDVRGIMRLLRQLGKSSRERGAPLEPSTFQQRLTTVSPGARFMFRQALASLAAQAPTDQPDQPLLLKLAEHLAIRFALESYERGEVRVDAVRQMLDRMAQEIEGLRKVLSAHEKKMAKAGMVVEPYPDLLDRQFWAEMPESGKHAALLSPEAWCIPPHNVRQYIEELLRRGERGVAQKVLDNYASCITREDPDARRRTAVGLCDLAELYADVDVGLLAEVIRQAGTQLSLERDAELQSLVSAAFVRLSQEAATRRCYSALKQALYSLDSVEKQRPVFAQSLRPRIGVENRLPEFVEDALRTDRVPEGLSDLLRLMPRPAAEHLTARFSHCGFREDCDLLIKIIRELGPDAVSYLRETLRAGPASEAVEVVGLLSRLDVAAIEQFLPGRLSELQRQAHDRAVRQLAAGGAPERGRLLLAIFDALDPLIRPLALDEIGMSGDPSAVPHLIRLAAGEVPAASAYLRLKAIEALGRLRAPEAAKLLRHIGEAKHFWGWVHPSELRIVAAQALQKTDPDWARDFLPRSGFNQAELSLAPLDPDPQSPCVRERRYPRLRLVRPVAAVTTNLRENCRMEIPILNLGGGLATSQRYLASGTVIALKINPAGLRPVRTQAFVRDARARTLGFEIADIDLKERSKLRRLLVQLGGSPVSGSPEGRGRRRRRGNP